MADQLSIELTAKIDGLRDGFNKAIREVDSFDKGTRSKLAAVDKGFASLANDVDKSLNRVSNTANKASNTISKDLSKVAQASAESGKAISATSVNFQGFSRILQDAAFGPAAIANNFEAAGAEIARIGQISKDTGQSIGKVLVNSLVGGGGLNLALGAVTLGLSLASFGMSAWTRLMGDNKKATGDAKKANDDYASSLDQVTQAQLKGSQNAQQEITQLGILYKVTQNVSLSSKQRLDAVDALQAKYPEYFKNIKDETILNGGAKDAYDRLTTSIIATARARAAQDLITKNSSRQLENEQKITDLEVKRLKDLATAEKNLATIRGGGTGQGAAGFADIAGKAEKRANDLLSQQNNLRTDSAILAERNLKLTESITEQIQKGADLSGKFADVPKETESKLKSFADILKELQQALLINDNQFQSTFGERNTGAISAYQSAIESLLNNGYKPLSEEVIRLKKEQQDLFQLRDLPTISANTGINQPRNTKGTFGVGITGQRSTDFFSNFTDQERKVYEAQARIIQSQEKFNTQISELATSGLTSSLGGIGDAIGSALASGGNVLEAVGQSLLSSLGGILIELGKAAIAVGVGMLAIKAAFKNPVTAIAAGVALVALGSFINNKVSKITSGGSNAQSQQSRPIPQFASGVNNFSGGMALVGERGPELVNLPTGASVIPNGRTERMMRNNNSEVVLNGNFGISMETLYFSLKRTEKKLGRLG